MIWPARTKLRCPRIGCREWFAARDLRGAEGRRSPTVTTQEFDDGPVEKSAGPSQLVPMIRRCLRTRREPAESPALAPREPSAHLLS